MAANILNDIESILPRKFTTPRDIWWPQNTWNVVAVREALVILHRAGRAERARVRHPNGVCFLYRMIEREPIAARA